nr:expressed conserved protein [Hymenolepis microstoma]
MEALLGLNGAGGIGGGCCCQCEHCRCRQPDETPCPGCRPVNPTPTFETSTSVQTSKPADVSGALELLNVALKKIKRRENLTNARSENFFHPGEILWGSGVPSGRMGHSHGYAGSNSASLF